ncbi:MAG TPA: hypothetical protein VNR18_11820 [Hyphomicrobiales bacterium]|nr:hypothetical protein [Hyphomicrobiales bacterium]
MRSLLTLLFALAVSPLVRAAAPDTAWPTPSPTQLQWLGERIYANECNRQPACLLSWNVGEDFPSLGIGHFIWYRVGQEGIYHETFPALLRFLSEQGRTLPAWLSQGDFEQPWPDRESFLAAREGEELQALQALLQNSVELQTAFIVQRFQAALPTLLASAPPDERAMLEQRLLQVTQAAPPYGLYALIDYVHFKGEGTRESERYQAQGWGLLQVLQAMPAAGDDPLAAFVAAADTVLTRRVANAPAERGEERWLPGWRNRLLTYLPAP